MAFLGDDIFHQLHVTSNNKVANKTVKEKTKWYENLSFTFILASIGWHITIQFKEWKQLKNVKRKYDQIKMLVTTIRNIIYNVQSESRLKAVLAKNKNKNKSFVKTSSYLTIFSTNMIISISKQIYILFHINDWSPNLAHSWNSYTLYILFSRKFINNLIQFNLINIHLN